MASLDGVEKNVPFKMPIGEPGRVADPNFHSDSYVRIGARRSDQSIALGSRVSSLTGGNRHPYIGGKAGRAHTQETNSANLGTTH